MEAIVEHRASSFTDAGLWRKLLEKAKKGTTTESYFAADIVVENLPSSVFPKLGLPAAFLEHHRGELTENIILEGHDGHRWQVMLGLSWDSKPCLMQGWVEFATDCNLDVGDQILFFLLENSHFQFRVFDSNYNIKRTVCATSAADVARTTLPQVKDPIQSFGFTTGPNIVSLPSGNNNSGVAKEVKKENHTTQDSPSGEKLGNQEPGVGEEDDRVADFNANSGEVVEGFQSAPLDAEEDGRWRDELRKPGFDVPAGTVAVSVFLKRAKMKLRELEGAPVRKSKEPDFTQEVLPVKRARQAPFDRSQPVSSSPSKTRQARGMKKTSSDDPDSRATKSAPPAWKKQDWHGHDGHDSKPWAARIAQDVITAGVARKAEADREGPYGGVLAARIAQAAIAADRAKKEAKAEANKEGEAKARVPASVPEREPVTPMPARVPASVPEREPVTPMPVEAPKQALKRPASVPESDPLTSMPLEAPKQAPKRVFKRPQPRNPHLLFKKQLLFSKRRPVTQQERLAALEEAQQYADSSYNRVQVIQLTAAQVYFGKHLDGTVEFAKTMELPLTGFKEVVLYDRSGRTTQAVWSADHPMSTGFRSPGWSSFVLDHFLQEGDVCVFELTHPKVNNIEVTVFPVVPLNPKAKKWTEHYSVEAPVAPAVVQPEADLSPNHWAPLGQSPISEKEDSGIEGKRRRLVIDLNSGESDKNKRCEEDKSNEKGKRCMEETTAEG